MKYLLVLIGILALTGCLPDGDSSTGAHIEGDNNIICLGNAASDEDDATGASFNCGNPSTVTEVAGETAAVTAE